MVVCGVIGGAIGAMFFPIMSLADIIANGGLAQSPLDSLIIASYSVPVGVAVGVYLGVRNYDRRTKLDRKIDRYARDADRNMGYARGENGQLEFLFETLS